MKALIKFFGILLAIFLLIVWFFFDNIKGYYTFKEYCEKEGGLTVYEPLEKNVGWLAEDKDAAETALLLGNIDFVRYTDKDTEITYDMKYLGGDTEKESSFLVSVSDMEKPVIYHWNYVGREVPDELRLYISGYEIKNIKTQRSNVRYHIISYSRFDRAKTILDAPSTVRCFDIPFSSPRRGADDFIKKIQIAFKK